MKKLILNLITTDPNGNLTIFFSNEFQSENAGFIRRHLYRRKNRCKRKDLSGKTSFGKIN
jgi:hypothetical protein